MKFNIELGDWSNDGHGESETFLMNTDAKDIDEVREAYFQAPEVIGFELGSLCSDCGETYINNDDLPSVIKLLEEMGFNDSAFELTDSNGEADEEILINIIVAALNKVNPKLNIKCETDEVETLHFYGFDRKGRHLEIPGYGLFN